jgi:hypothetical protein
MGLRRSAYRVLVGKPEGKKPLWRHKYKLQDNKKTIFKNWDGGIISIDVAQGRDRWWALVNAVRNLPVP